ncbi:hypothetical protein AB0M92_29565 [Streptomyces sp. NPDC051582]|uniref:hypothetical protein n=1 Tax=Streptomyces sp. NPDC051582 TaxID=3155167 RepID=UPI00342C62BA
MGGPNAPTCMGAITILCVPVALTVGNFLTSADVVAAGSWIATTAGLGQDGRRRR